MPVIDTIKFRRGTAAAWTAANPTLAIGEPGYETDTGLMKVGDGTTAWVSLDYTASGADGATAFDELADAETVDLPTTNTPLAAALSLKVPTTRSINGQSLAANVTIAKSDIGLTNVDNTSDATVIAAAKVAIVANDLTASTTEAPSKTAVNTGLATKQATLVSATNIKSINGSSIVGAGDLVIAGTAITDVAWNTAFPFDTAGFGKRFATHTTAGNVTVPLGASPLEGGSL